MANLPQQPREWRPSARHSAPIVILAIIGAVACLWLAVNLALAGNAGGAIVFAAVAAGLPLSLWAYFHNARIIIGPDWVGKRDIIGRVAKCPTVMVARIETRYLPQPSLCFVRSDGALAFRVNRRLWRDDQVVEIQRELGLTPI